MSPSHTLPQLFEGLGLSWPVFKTGQRTALLEVFGEEMVEVTGVSGDLRSMTLADHIRDTFLAPDHPWYLRDKPLSDGFQSLSEGIPAIPMFENWLIELSEDVRPDWAWLFVGPRGTGSGWHVDIDGSAAWNLLIEGEKHWEFESPLGALKRGLLPPTLAPALEEAFEAAEIEFVQGPGDVVLTPSLWAHRVSNLGPTISVTGNFINATNANLARDFLAAAGEIEQVELMAGLLKEKFPR